MMTPGGEEWGLSGGLRSPGAGGRGSDPGRVGGSRATHQRLPMRQRINSHLCVDTKPDASVF